MAKQFVSEGLTFAVSDRGSFTYELQALGLDTSVKDVIVGLYDAKGAKYAMEPDFSVDNLREFAQEYLDGGLEPYIKSEPVPEDNSGPVKVVCVCVCVCVCMCVGVCVCVKESSNYCFFFYSVRSLLARILMILLMTQIKMYLLSSMLPGVVTARHWHQNMMSWERRLAV